MSRFERGRLVRTECRWARPALVALGLSGGLTVSSARAEERVWRLYGEVQTEFPLTVGARVLAEGPHRLRFGTSLGYLPGPYLDAINEAMVAVEGYSEPTAKLISVALQSSLLWRAEAGWRPVADLGTYVEFQYTFMGLGGGLGSESLVVGGAELDAPMRGRDANGFDLGSAIHMVGLEAGYTWEFDSGLTLRAGLGFELTLAASFDVTARQAGPGTDLIEKGAKDYLDQVFVEWVNTPHVAVAAGYRFF